MVRWLAATWLSLTLALVAVSVAPRLLGWTPSVVVSGSMRPALEPGHVVLVDPAGRPLVAAPATALLDQQPGALGAAGVEADHDQPVGRRQQSGQPRVLPGVQPQHQ